MVRSAELSSSWSGWRSFLILCGVKGGGQERFPPVVWWPDNTEYEWDSTQWLGLCRARHWLRQPLCYRWGRPICPGGEAAAAGELCVSTSWQWLQLSQQRIPGQENSGDKTIDQLWAHLLRFGSGWKDKISLFQWEILMTFCCFCGNFGGIFLKIRHYLGKIRIFWKNILPYTGETATNWS